MKEVIWSLVMHLSRDTWDLQMQQWGISRCGFSQSSVGIALHIHLPSTSEPVRPQCSFLSRDACVHACCTPKQEYVWIQGSTRLKLWLDTNDIGNCKESPFIFLRHVLFLYTLLNNWVNSFKQSLIKFKKILSHFGPYSNAGLFLFLSLKSCFPFFFFFFKYFHSRVAVGRTPCPESPLVKWSKGLTPVKCGT